MGTSSYKFTKELDSPPVTIENADKWQIRLGTKQLHQSARRLLYEYRRIGRQEKAVLLIWRNENGANLSGFCGVSSSICRRRQTGSNLKEEYCSFSFEGAHMVLALHL